MADAKASTTSDVIKLVGWRLSFPRLFKPKSFRPGQDPRFEATFLGDPSDKAHAEQIATIKAATKKILQAKYGDKIPNSIKENLCFGSGDTKDYEGYAGMFRIATSSKERPKVVDEKKNPLAAEDGKPYAGCYVNAIITLWVMDNEFGKRVNANLKAVQFAKDGESFGVKPIDTDEVFDDLSGEGESATSTASSDDDDFLS